jgi:nitroreductase
VKTSDAIRGRRSIKKFRNEPVTREQIETLVSAAVLAPNHRLTNPWRFYVLGPEAREKYGLALGDRKAKKLPDPIKADEVRRSVAAEHRALPAMIAVAVVEASDAEQKQEDYAATMMAVGNMMLVAVEMGLGTSIKTGGVMSDPAARAAVGVADNERIVAVVNVGVPAETPPEKNRTAAADLTSWVP